MSRYSMVALDSSRDDMFWLTFKDQKDNENLSLSILACLERDDLLCNLSPRDLDTLKSLAKLQTSFDDSFNLILFFCINLLFF